MRARDSGLGTRGSGLWARVVTLTATLLLILIPLTCLSAAKRVVVARGLQPPGGRVEQAGRVPARIISLVPSATEVLFAIGAGPRVVAVSSFDHFPPDVERLARVGALVDPDVERILSLRPDLVVAYASQTDLRAQLDRAGIPLYVYRHGSLADITAGMRSLGARLGLTAEAEAAASSLERDLERVRASVAGLPRLRTVLVIGREPQSLRAVNVSGGVGFLHDLLELAGGDNVFGDVMRESAVASTETILARRPEAIIEVHYLERAAPGEEAQERQAWNQLPGLPAVKSGRVYLLYGGELVVPGPRVAETARAFARALHPATSEERRRRSP